MIRFWCGITNGSGVTSRIKQAYRAVESITGSEFLEPLCDVERVNHLRQCFRPKQVKLLIIGESHVRRREGPGFIYDAGYYTPWWRDLLWPAFGRIDGSRAENLRFLCDKGVWILDASVIALSGYRNVQREWPARPLDPNLTGILAASWNRFVRQEFESAGAAHIVYFERAGAMLPEQTRRNGTALRFNGPRHAKALRYNDPQYRFGSARFIEAVRAAGL